MRIYGNRQLKTLPGKETRPTTGRVREAVFNIWQGAIANCRWLDLCAGNGSMGAEALCRGAALVVGIEQSSRACAIINQNWTQIAQPQQQFQVLRGDVVQRLKTLEKQFDRIYFDPPYASNLYQPVLNAIALFQILEPTTGELAVEHSPDWQPPLVTGLEICREKVYGNTALTFFRSQKSESRTQQAEFRIFS